MSDYQPTKKPNTKVEYTAEQLKELILCQDDPYYFIENYIKVVHPVKGVLPLQLYPFQWDIVRGFHEHQNCVVLTARQMGKSLDYDTSILHNGVSIKLGSLVKLTFKEWVVRILEGWLLKLSR